jgi:hypothetical protein
MTEPGIRALIRPVITVRPASAHAKVVTVDWDELLELAEWANDYTNGDEPPLHHADYAAGVRDGLRWLASGVPTAALLDLLGGR